MLGNFSFGGYGKREAIRWAYEFLTQTLGVAPERISVSVFVGEGGVPYDKESFDIWHMFLNHIPLILLLQEESLAELIS